MVSKAKLLLSAFGFLTHFYSEASHGDMGSIAPKTTLKFWVHVQAITPNLYTAIAQL